MNDAWFDFPHLVLLLCSVCVAIADTEVPIAFGCEFKLSKCCPQVLGAVKLAIHDSANKDGVVIPELANLTQPIQLKIKTVFDPSTTSGKEKFLANYDGSEEFPPVALIGSKYDNFVDDLAQDCGAFGISQLGWPDGPRYDRNPVYSQLFRLSKTTLGNLQVLHRVLRLGEIANVAVIYHERSYWSKSMKEEFLKLCATSADWKCHTTVYGTTENGDLNFIDKTLKSIRSIGLRSIVNLLSEPSEFLKRAALMDMAGTEPRAAGYLHLYPEIPPAWQNAPEGDTYWHGSICAGLFQEGMHPQKVATLVQHWTQVVPKIRMDDMPGYFLSRKDAFQIADGCKWLASLAYEDVARMRMALERVNMSLPRKPSPDLIVKEWMGTALVAELQAGTTMHGIVRGQTLRKSSAIGQPWEENDEKLYVLNYVNHQQKALPIYEDAMGTLVALLASSQGILPGGVPFNNNAWRGNVVKTACDVVATKACTSHLNFGLCQDIETVGRAPGWCLCHPGYTGQYCDVEGTLKSRPRNPVLVNITIGVAQFIGMDKNGEYFDIVMRVGFTWMDHRCPWDAGVYQGTESKELLETSWHPQVSINEARTSLSMESVEISRIGPEVPGVTSPAKLETVSRLIVHKDMSAVFEEFPFDKHDIELQIDLKEAMVEAKLMPTTLVTEEVLDQHWSREWQAVKSDGWGKVTQGAGGDNSFKVKFQIERNSVTNVFTMLVPIVVLEILSWSAFFIKPAALMPRFASGFISFLSLQGFRGTAVKLMPHDGQLSTMCWFDVFVSMVGILMGLAVLETVLVQWVADAVSPLPCRSIDIAARIGFPVTFCLGSLVLALPIPTSQGHIVSHVLVGLFAVCFGVYSCLQAFWFPEMVLRQSIQVSASGARRHSAKRFNDTELQLIYDHALKKQGTKDSGMLKVASFQSWIEGVKPVTKKHHDEILEIIKTAFGADEFGYPVFKEEFPMFLTKVTLVLHSEAHQFAAKVSNAAHQFAEHGHSLSRTFPGFPKEHEHEHDS